MSRPPGSEITRPGGHPAKNSHRAGAPNTQQSGETLMVGTSDPAHTVAVREIQELLYSNAERFVEADHASGAVLVRFPALADLVAELVARPRAERAALWDLLKRMTRLGIEEARYNTELHIEWFDVYTNRTLLRTGLCEVLGHDTNPAAYPGDERVLADLRDLAAENRLRENEVISLGCEVEKLERALSEAARDSETAARFVDTMMSGGDRR